MSNKRYSGYTLIEILIVLAIMGILFVVGYAGFRDFSRREQVNAAALTLVADIKAMQQMNLQGKKPFGCTGALAGYSFQVVSAQSYKTVANCINNGIANNIDVKVVTLPSNISISTPTPNPVFFKSVGQGTNIPTSSFATLTLTQASTGNVRSAYISSSGEVREDSGLARVDFTASPTPFFSSPTPVPSITPTPSPTPPLSGNARDSYCVGYSMPATMTVNQSVQASITFFNTGTLTWTDPNFDASQWPWPPNTIAMNPNGHWALAAGSVAQGQSLTWNFTLVAPSTPGTYSANYRMLEQNVAWFGASCGRDIVVN